MNISLFSVGIAKVAFGGMVGAVGIFIGLRMLSWLMRTGSTDESIRQGNLAIGVLSGSILFAFGILIQHSVSATFEAMDLLYRGHLFHTSMLPRFGLYAILHVGFSLTVGAAVLAFGAWVFNRLTQGVDEIEEVRQGNVAPAILLGSVLIVMALVTAPGVRTALDGLLPLPQLARDLLPTPS